jgi:hypothetical protein
MQIFLVDELMFKCRFGEIEMFVKELGPKINGSKVKLAVQEIGE